MQELSENELLASAFHGMNNIRDVALIIIEEPIRMEGMEMTIPFGILGDFFDGEFEFTSEKIQSAYQKAISKEQEILRELKATLDSLCDTFKAAGDITELGDVQSPDAELGALKYATTHFLQTSLKYGEGIDEQYKRRSEILLDIASEKDVQPIEQTHTDVSFSTMEEQMWAVYEHQDKIYRASAILADTIHKVTLLQLLDLNASKPTREKWDSLSTEDQKTYHDDRHNKSKRIRESVTFCSHALGTAQMAQANAQNTKRVITVQVS